MFIHISFVAPGTTTHTVCRVMQGAVESHPDSGNLSKSKQNPSTEGLDKPDGAHETRDETINLIVANDNIENEDEIGTATDSVQSTPLVNADEPAPTFDKAKAQRQASNVTFKEEPIKEQDIIGEEEKVLLRQKPVLSWWMRFRRSVRRHSSVVYSALYKKQNYTKCLSCMVIGILLTLIGAAVMAYLLYTYHTENNRLSKELYHQQEESKCVNDYVSNVYEFYVAYCICL